MHPWEPSFGVLEGGVLLPKTVTVRTPGFLDPTELALCRSWIVLTLQVVCRTKRMGGGFGGKETRSVFLSCVAAVGAHLSGRPVRLSLDREVDMQITGHRHSFFAKYKAGASK